MVAARKSSLLLNPYSNHAIGSAIIDTQFSAHLDTNKIRDANAVGRAHGEAKFQMKFHVELIFFNIVQIHINGSLLFSWIGESGRNSLLILMRIMRKMPNRGREPAEDIS